MRTLYLQKITQHGIECYIGKIDPRELVRVATKIEMGDTQDAQRPLNEKRVKDIAKYINDKNGILPNTLTIASKDNRFIINESSNVKGLYYTNFPTEDNEFFDYKDSIDVMDGQHRLYSFLDDIRLLDEEEIFEMGFTLYIKPTLTERRSIFVSCNEKQEKVSGNLLMWFKEKLDLLNATEKNFYNLVSKLNSNYPLKGKIIMSAEKISKGFKADQVMEALKNAHIQDLAIGDNLLTEDQKVKVICTYLSAWETVCGFSFVNSTAKQAGVAIKMAGLRYMLLLLQSIWERSIAIKQKFDSKYVEETLKKYISTFAVEREKFFTHDDHKYWYRDRTAISEAANVGIRKIKAMESEDFNPLS